MDQHENLRRILGFDPEREPGTDNHPEFTDALAEQFESWISLATTVHTPINVVSLREEKWFDAKKLFCSARDRERYHRIYFTPDPQTSNNKFIPRSVLSITQSRWLEIVLYQEGNKNLIAEYTRLKGSFGDVEYEMSVKDETGKYRNVEIVYRSGILDGIGFTTGHRLFFFRNQIPTPSSEQFPYVNSPTQQRYHTGERDYFFDRRFRQSIQRSFVSTGKTGRFTFSPQKDDMLKIARNVGESVLDELVIPTRCIQAGLFEKANLSAFLQMPSLPPGSIDIDWQNPDLMGVTYRYKAA